MFILIQNEQPYISKCFLSRLGVEENTIKVWKTRYREAWIEHSSTSYFAYTSIPDKTKKEKRIPPASVLIREQQKNIKVETIYNALVTAKTFDFTVYLETYQKDASLTTLERTEAAKLHAVWNCLFEMRKKGDRDLQYQYEAFRKLYPEKYNGKTGKNSFSNVLKKGRTNGIEALAFDRKKYGNNREENAKLNKAALKYYLTFYAADPQNFTCTEMLAMVNQGAKEIGFPEVSLSWIKKQRALALKNIAVSNSRRGIIDTNRILPHTKFIAASAINVQWQIDGMKPAFWGPKFESYSYVRVQDSHSKKIIGWSFGKTENKEIIVDAIRDAVTNTGYLPNELVADNHSFNKTQEAQNLYSVFKKKGAEITITSNPRHKVIIERENQNINKLSKRYYGNLGEGIRSKNKDAHPKDELKAEFQKNFLSEFEIHAVMLLVTNDYNNTAQKNGKTPNEMYAASTNPKAIIAGMWERAELLTLQTEKLIRSGQMSFQKGIDKIEFQLPAHLHEELNNTKVLVKYSDLNESIYLFDIKTGEAIIDLRPKQAHHNAKADQTEKDIELLNKNKGRITGIISQATKRLEKLTEEAANIDKDAHARASKLSTPKEVVKELEKSGLIQEAEERGIKVNMIDTTGRPIRQAIPALRPKEKKETNPFSVKDNVISKIKSSLK